MIVASRDLSVKPPWVIVESKNVPGRFFFYNTETGTSEWSIPSSLVNAHVSENMEPARKRPRAETHSERHRIEDDTTVSQADADSQVHQLVDVSNSVSIESLHMVAASPQLYGYGGGTFDSGGLGHLSSFDTKIQSQRSLLNVVPKAGIDSYDNVAEIMHASDTPAPYRVLDGLGLGGYGVVVEVENVITKGRFAMKAVCKKKLLRRRTRESLRLELDIMRNMKPHPFVQTFHEAFETSCTVFMVTELQLGGDIFYHLIKCIREQQTGLPEDIVRIILAELTLALEHVHKEGYLHRDVKVENVMLDASGHVKLIDFGLACELKGEMTPLSPTGSLIYMAPEIITNRVGGRYTDWWAVGVVTYEMLTGSSPWSTLSDRELMKREIKHAQILLPGVISTKAGSFIQSLLRKDFRARLGTASDSDIKSATFFDTVDWDQVANLKGPPAFMPPIGECMNPTDKAESLKAYSKLLRVSRRLTNTTPCSMGLRVLGSCPPVVPTGLR